MLDKDKIEIGDKVKYIENIPGFLKNGDIYTVSGFRKDEGEIIGVYLKEFNDKWYYLRRFDSVPGKTYSVYKPVKRRIKL